MSMDETPARARRRWPMSWTNTVLVFACLVGAVILFIVDNPFAAIVLIAAGVLGGISAIFARRGSSGDLERVNALEYADERDRAAATKGLAVVGVVALVASIVQLLIHASLQTRGIAMWTSILLVLLLTIAWLIGNWFAVRRG